MLVLSEQLTGTPVMSLQTGTQIALTRDVIIDPANLGIAACYVDGASLESEPTVLFTNDIRESGELGFIVDDSSKLMALDGLVRLQQLIDQKFKLVGMSVVDRRGTKLGKVEDYSFDPDSFMIQQLFVKPSFLQSLTQGSRIVHRSQIIDVTPHLITIGTAEITETMQERAEEASSFVNPFRSPGQETH